MPPGEVIRPGWLIHARFPPTPVTGTSIGVRASQAGDAFDRPMFTSFGVQWFDKARGTWLPVAGAVSPWQAAGPGPWLARESGWTQTFVP